MALKKTQPDMRQNRDKIEQNKGQNVIKMELRWRLKSAKVEQK